MRECRSPRASRAGGVFREPHNERAGLQESSVRSERAVHGESADFGERAVAWESAGDNERAMGPGGGNSVRPLVITTTVLSFWTTLAVLIRANHAQERLGWPPKTE